MGGKELKWRQLTHNQLMSPQGPHFSPHSTAKTTIKAQISGRMASIGISDVVTASVSSEKTRMKKCMMIMIIIIIRDKPFTNKTLGRARDPRANGAWLSKLTE